MRDIDELVHRELGMNVRRGRPIHVDGLDKESNPAAFAAIAGALAYAHHNYAERPIFGFNKLLKGLFK